jgi:hypothetical protein
MRSSVVRVMSGMGFFIYNFVSGTKYIIGLPNSADIDIAKDISGGAPFQVAKNIELHWLVNCAVS